MKKHPLVGTVLQAVVLVLAATLGITLTPDDAGTVVVIAWLNGLTAAQQVGILVVVALLALMPWIARWTPWTGDDGLIEYQSPVKRFFLAVWNSLAGNDGFATNAPRRRDQIQPKR